MASSSTTATPAVGEKRKSSMEGSELSGGRRVSEIRNKIKRNQLFAQRKHDKAKLKKRERQQRQKDVEEGRAEKQLPKTQETMREADVTTVAPDDAETLQDEAVDEFSAYFTGQPPKLMVTTCQRPSKSLKEFVKEVTAVFPQATYYKRGTFDLKKIISYAKLREFTDLLVFSEYLRKPCTLLLVHLPGGPTANFRISSVRMREDIAGHGKPTLHQPEIILNNFGTRLGHTVGRMLAALFPQNPQFKGRRVVTFHNQRDFVFFRHHRYIFSNVDAKDPRDVDRPQQKKPKKKAASKPTGFGGDAADDDEVDLSGGSDSDDDLSDFFSDSDDDKDHSAPDARLQEIGPRFTLKLRSLQHGIFDGENPQYEWLWKREMATSRKRFFL